jgi:hypothetical protein
MNARGKSRSIEMYRGFSMSNEIESVLPPERDDRPTRVNPQLKLQATEQTRQKTTPLGLTGLI